MHDGAGRPPVPSSFWGVAVASAALVFWLVQRPGSAAPDVAPAEVEGTASTAARPTSVPPASGEHASPPTRTRDEWRYPTFDDLPASQRLQATRQLAQRLEGQLDEHADAASVDVGEPDCSEPPCMVPVALGASDPDEGQMLTGLVLDSAAALAGAPPITVVERLDDGTTKLWLYWNPPGGDGRTGSEFQIRANQRALSY